MKERSCLNCKHVSTDVFRGKRYVNCLVEIPEISARKHHWDYLDTFDNEDEIIHLAALDCVYFESD